MRSPTKRDLLCSAVIAALALSTSGRAAPPNPKDQIPAVRNEASIRGDFTLGAIGDLILGRPTTKLGYVGFDSLVKQLKSADVTVANQEIPIVDMPTYKGQRTVYTRLQAPATLAKDVAAMGIDLVSTANNHAMDWGVDGVLQMQAWLDKAGVQHAGSGKTLGSARAPAFFETAKGRVALVATASTFSEDAPAADQVGEAPARAGISMLRTRRIALVSPEEMQTLRAIVTRHAVYRTRPPKPDAKQLNVFGQAYRVSDKRGFTYEMNPYDEFEILKSVRAAKSLSDLTIFSIHAHESATGSDDDSPVPADFLPELFHNAVDAGADVVVGGGSHSLRGIEIYKGKPILYGIGLFTLQSHFIVSPEGYQASGLNPYTDIEGDFRNSQYGDEWPGWSEGFVAMVDFKDGKARRVRIYPTDLRPTATKPTGIPEPANPVRAQEILKSLQAKSVQFGTKIRIENNVGIVDIPQT